MFSISFILIMLISIFIQTHGQLTCASGWIQNGESCYLIRPAFNSGSTSGTWDQCNAYCTASYSGATMLCVNNAAENEWMWTQYGSSYRYWIGYTDMLPYGGGKGTMNYGWVTGCSSTYTNWRSSQPNNNGNIQDYASVNWEGTSKWDDLDNAQQFNCGCQYKLSSTMTPSSNPSAVPSSRPTTAPSSTVAPTTARPSTVAPTTSSPSTVAPTTSSPSTVVPTTASPPTPSTTVPSKDGFFTCHWKFYSSQPGSVFQQDSLMTSSAVDSETVPEFDYFYYVVFASVALGSLLTLLIQASLHCCTRKAYAVADRSEYLPIIGRE